MRSCFFLGALGLVACRAAPPTPAPTENAGSTGSAASTAALDGSESSSADTSSGEAPPPTKCGNGVLDFAEQCDDGNAEDADGCNRDCVPSGMERWRREANEGGEFLGLAVDDEDLLYTGWVEQSRTTLMVLDRGSTILDEVTLDTSATGWEVGASFRDGFARSSSGARAWVDQLEDASTGAVAVRVHVYAEGGLTVDELLEGIRSADIVAVGDAFVLAYDQDDGTTVERRELDGSSTWSRDFATPLTRIMVAPDGGLLAVGETVDLLDPSDGSTGWTVPWFEGAVPDGVAVGAEMLRVLGPSDLPIPDRWAVDLNPSGRELARGVFRPLSSTPISTAIFDDEGNFVFVEGGLFKLDATDAPLWETDTIGVGDLHTLSRGDIVISNPSYIALHAP